MVFWNRLEKLDLRLRGDFIAVFMYFVGEYVFLRRQPNFFQRCIGKEEEKGTSCNRGDSDKVLGRISHSGA